MECYEDGKFIVKRRYGRKEFLVGFVNLETDVDLALAVHNTSHNNTIGNVI